MEAAPLESSRPSSVTEKLQLFGPFQSRPVAATKSWDEDMWEKFCFTDGEMWKNKTGNDRTRNLNKRQKACKSGREKSVLHLGSTFEEQFGSLYNSNQGVWSVLVKEVASNLCRSVVSLALFDGNTMIFSCTGITIAHIHIPRDLHSTIFLTSACLVKAFNDARNRNDNLKVKVCLPGNKTAEGHLGLYDRDIAVVTSMYPATVLLGLRPVHLDQVQSGHQSRAVAAVCALKSGSLMATSGMLIDGLSGVDHEHRMVCTCKITKAALGGPLIDLDGNFVGMSLSYDMEKTWFLPWSSILQRLRQFQILGAGNKQGGNQEVFSPPDSIPGVSSVVPSGQMARFEWLDSMGYPRPSLAMIECEGYLHNTFEEYFGDIWKGANFFLRCSREVIWRKLDKTVATNISQSVVSLASFNGNMRFFACTGLLIQWNGCTRILTSASLVRTCDGENNIDDNLRIEVFLPPNQRAKGTLTYYNLNYNIAIVSVQGFHAICPANILDQVQSESKKVIAIGRIFDDGILMATSGEVTTNFSGFDCKDLMLSTCKIKKAGIGGPLVDVDGSFVGMNFYDEQETPFLPRNKILQVLAHFDGEGALDGVSAGAGPAELTGDCKPNRWPVPKPYWYASLLDEQYLMRCRRKRRRKELA